jgi:phytol kinase
MMIAIFVVLSVLFIGGVEVLKRSAGLSPETSRRVAHVGAALIAAVSPYFLGAPIIVVACLIFALLVLIGRRTALLSSIHGVQRTSYGDVCLPLGEALAAALFLPHSLIAFQFGVLVMGLADPAAGIIGERFGRRSLPVPWVSKTLEGSCVFFIVACSIAAVFVPSLGATVFALGAVLTLVEGTLGYGLDNLVLPAVGGTLLLALL